MPRTAKIFLVLYLLILAAFLAGKPLNSDAYYYWNWSYHLALSYYDGPPMIAYIIKLFTTVFGHHDYSLYLFNLTSAAVTALVVFRLGQQLFNPTAATISMIIWLTTLTVVHTYFIHLTYDTALILFWALTFYLFVQLIERKQIRYYYLSAMAAGMMLLSHYKGVLLLIALLLLCLFEKRYRFILKTLHCYLALLLMLLFFSPVLIWNAQHHWVSFQFQLHHGLNTFHSPPWTVIIRYLHSALTGSNITFLALLYVLATCYREIFSDHTLRLLVTPTLFTWLFFLISGFFSLPLPFWNTPFVLTAAILLGPFCQRGMRSIRLRCLFLIALAIPTLIILILSRIPAMTIFNAQPIYVPVNTIYIPPKIAKKMLSALPANLYRDKPLFVSDSYTLGSYLAAFLPGKRYQVFSTTPLAGQYFYWWQQNQSMPDNNQPSISPTRPPYPALYFRFTRITGPLPPHFESCTLITHLQQRELFILFPDCIWQIFVYHCHITMQKTNALTL